MTMKMFDLTGRVAIITGGNGGISLCMARGMTAAGAAVVVAARNRAKSEAAVAELERAGASSACIALDIADPASCRDVVQQTVARFGRLDILVNNAGMSVRKPPEQYEIAEWRVVLDTNLTGAFACAQAAYAPMQRQGGGQDHQYRLDDGDLRRGLHRRICGKQRRHVQMTCSLATAWAKDNIQVNAVMPGWIDTELTIAARQQVPGLHERS